MITSNPAVRQLWHIVSAGLKLLSTNFELEIFYVLSDHDESFFFCLNNFFSENANRNLNLRLFAICKELRKLFKLSNILIQLSSSSDRK